MGLSRLIYTASILSVPELAMQQTQRKLFSFLWKNKRDKIKRQVLCRPLSRGGLGFPCFRTAIKALRLSWIGRLLNNSKDTWQGIPNHYFDKHGGLLFLLNCNYSVRKYPFSIVNSWNSSKTSVAFTMIRSNVNLFCGTTKR